MCFKFFTSGAVSVSILLAATNIAPLGTYTAAERRHWAFQKRSNPEIPKFTAPIDKAWAKTPIDAFVLAR